jgi:hypothetical protein
MSSSSVILQLRKNSVNYNESVFNYYNSNNNNNQNSVDIGFQQFIINGKKCRFNLNINDQSIVWEQELSNNSNNGKF